MLSFWQTYPRLITTIVILLSLWLSWLSYTYLSGAGKNARHENSAQSQMQKLKLQDMIMRHKIEWMGNATPGPFDKKLLPASSDLIAILGIRYRMPISYYHSSYHITYNSRPDKQSNKPLDKPCYCPCTRIALFRQLRLFIRCVYHILMSRIFHHPHLCAAFSCLTFLCPAFSASLSII